MSLDGKKIVCEESFDTSIDEYIEDLNGNFFNIKINNLIILCGKFDFYNKVGDIIKYISKTNKEYTVLVKSIIFKIGKYGIETKVVLKICKE